MQQVEAKGMSNNRLQGWLKEIWHWLGEAKLAFLGFLTVTNAMLYGFIVWHSEDSIRIAGYALQLIGMLFAIRGLLRIREYFKQP
jgi:hypothetical protein